MVNSSWNNTVNYGKRQRKIWKNKSKNQENDERDVSQLQVEDTLKNRNQDDDFCDTPTQLGMVFSWIKD